MSGLTGWTVDTTLADITASTGSVTGATFAAGVLTLTITGATDGVAETVAVIMKPPQDSDVDAHVTMTATAATGATQATSAATSGVIYVDAVADMPTAQITVVDSADAGNSFSNGESGTLEVKATFGDVVDGSETHTMTVTLQPGFLATELTVGTHTGWTHNGVTYNLTYTYTPTDGTTNGQIAITIPDNLTSLVSPINLSDNSSNVDLLFGIQAPSSGTLPDLLNFSVHATATETPTDGGCGPNNTDIAIGNSADNSTSADASTGIPATRILDGSLITNTASGAQEMILTFVDQEHPLDAFSQLFVREVQGQQGGILSDAGFNIKKTDHFQIGLENPIDGHKVIVTDFTLEGVAVNAPSGNIQLEHEGSSNKADGITTVMQPSAGGSVTGTYSADGDQNVNTLTSSSSTFNMLYGAEGNDTLNGSSAGDLLSGGAGNDILKGNGGNDILVYDPADTGVAAINGGSGFDILRIDQGALFNTAASQGGFSVPGISNNVVDLSSKTSTITNMEAILLTEEYHPDSSLGTELQGMTGANVIAFTGGAGAVNAQTGTANTLFVIGSPGDDVQLSGWTEQAATYSSTNGQLFHQWTQTVSGISATLYIDNDLQVNHAAQ